MTFRSPFRLCSLMMLVLALLLAAGLPQGGAEEEFTQQPLPTVPAGATVYFRDSFMREKPEEGEWSVASGRWTFDQAAKPGVSANPFSVRGSARGEAILETGEAWWRDYAAFGSLRTPPIYESFGVGVCRKGFSDGLYFLFTERDGLVLRLRYGGVVKDLATRKSFPLPYQWYRMGLGVHGRKAYCVLDGSLVFSVDLPVLMAGKMAVVAAGAPDYGVTVDDCSATTIPGDAANALALASRGFAPLFADERLRRQKFPSYFSTDRLMRKWASSEADWLAWVTPEPYEGFPDPPPSSYTAPLPFFGDIVVEVKFPDRGRVATFELMDWVDGSPGRQVCTVVVTPEPKSYRVSISGKEEFALNTADPLVRVEWRNSEVIVISGGQTIGPVTVRAISAALRDGVRLVIPSATYGFCSFGGLALDSTSLIEETFYEAPCEWLTVCGKWEIGSRWACSPQFTYLSSWDPTSSQLYSKHMFGGKVYADVWVSPKMHSFRFPGAYPLKLFCVSMPKSAGDLSTGLTFGVSTPTADEMAILADGKSVAAGKIGERMSEGGLHNAWIHMRVERSAKTTFKMDIVDARPKTQVYELSVPEGADTKPRPLVVWNSLTGFTVTRLRLTAQNIVRGGLSLSYNDSPALPCGVDTSLPSSGEDLVFDAPRFDFSKGSACWQVPSDQPGVVASPAMLGKTRLGLMVSSPFCGSRLSLVSPEMKVDARVWPTMTVRVKAGDPIALYLHSGLRKFRLILNARDDANSPDWAVPISAKFFSKKVEGKFTAVTLKLLDMFEEYQTLQVPPILDRMSFEKADLYSDDAIGLTAKDKQSFTVGGIEFSSPFIPKTATGMPVAEPETAFLNPTVTDFWSGAEMLSVSLPPLKAKEVLSPPPVEQFTERKGAVVIEFKDDYQSLSQVGTYEECQVWRQRIGGEAFLTATKSDLHGYFGLKLLSEPISLLDFPVLSIKFIGDISRYNLMVRSGTWKTIPLRPKQVVKLSSVGSRTEVKALGYPILFTDESASYLVVDLAEALAESGTTLLEEVFICSPYGVAVPSGTTLPVSSIVFYDPSKTAAFTNKGYGSKLSVTIPGVGEFKDMMVGKVVNMVLNASREPRRLPKSGWVASCDENWVVFEFDAPVSPDEVVVTIGPREYRYPLLKSSAPNRLAVHRTDIWNPENAVSWLVELPQKGYTTKLGEGELQFGAPNYPRVERLTIVPDNALLFEDFEHGIGTGSSRRSPAMVTASSSYSGRYSFETVSTNEKSLSGYLLDRPFDAAKYPFMSFGYRLTGANVTLMFKCEGHYKDAKFTPFDIPPLNLYKEIYYRIGPEGGMTLGVFGSVPGATADGRWHSSAFEIIPLLKGEVFNGSYLVSEVAVRECWGQDPGASVSIDNFCIFGRGAKSFRVNLSPPAGAKSKKMEYEWSIVSRDGVEVVKPARISETAFDVPVPKGDHLQLRVRLVLDDVPSPVATDHQLLFTTPAQPAK